MQGSSGTNNGHVIYGLKNTISQNDGYCTTQPNTRITDGYKSTFLGKEYYYFKIKIFLKEKMDVSNVRLHLTNPVQFHNLDKYSGLSGGLTSNNTFKSSEATALSFNIQEDYLEQLNLEMHYIRYIHLVQVKCGFSLQTKFTVIEEI